MYFELRVTIPETMKYFCVTEAVALYIQKYVQYRKRKIFFELLERLKICAIYRKA